MDRTRVIAEDATQGERRRSGRLPLLRPAGLCAGELVVHGQLTDISAGGAFFATRLLIEIGETGTLAADGVEIPVEVVWLRGNADGDGPGMGLVFTAEPPERERFVSHFSSE